ncbi:MAG: ABC transporter ATP-binding protein [Desulfobacterales bacterium]|jgi:ATP-binding cassette subfamily B protein|nr:ABC transporter ATP-binding protein [Desulfobacterales bacterium]MDD3082012.1 ABC transporter ATP-binding protein [Desulfobacterales bacterium]MDD3949776.1 ABC transporter ATP-binding protein [Desulfobacterales bacterium]MDY0377354.1 ABC transporter ATP-binding protein [Desulfobacterales bacterium]
MHVDYGYFEEQQLGKPYDIRLMRRMLPFATPYRGLLSFSVFLVILITVLDLALPYLTKIAIDQYIVPGGSQKSAVRHLVADLKDEKISAVVEKYSGLFEIQADEARIELTDLEKISFKDRLALRKNDLIGVTRMAGIFLLCVTLSFALNFLQVWIMEYAGQKIMHDLRVRLYTHIQDLSSAFFTRNPVGRLVTRVTSDVQNMHELFTSVITFVFQDVFLLVGISIVLLALHWQLALVTFTVIPFVALASVYFASQAREAFRTLRIKIAEINTRFAETIGGISIIQLFRRGPDNLRDFETLNHEHYLAGMRQIHVFALFMPVVELLGTVAMALVIYYGGSGVVSEHITLGELVAFLSYMKMFFTPIRDIAEKYNIMQNAMASAERIFLILDSEERIPVASDGSADPEHISDIVFENVCFSYVPAEPVLKDVAFRVHAGKTLALVGPTGSGKSSVIHLLIRFYAPDQGRILISGKDISAWNPENLRAGMALVAQDPFIFSATVRENIVGGNGDIGDEQMERIIDAACCRNLIRRLPKGLDTVLSEGGSSLSSGERQLIAMARAIARDPELIILDEATSYIDSGTEQDIQQAMANLMKGRTSILVAHRLATARSADCILVLRDGRIVESGTHGELMARKEFYWRLNQVQG